MEKTGDCRLEVNCLLGWLGRTVTPATVSAILRRLTKPVNDGAQENSHFLMVSIASHHPLALPPKRDKSEGVRRRNHEMGK